MSAADDRYRCEEVLTCLRRLDGGGTYTRKGLFSRVERWQERFLKRLITVNAVTSERQGRSRVYRMDDDLVLLHLIEDDEARLDLIFNARIPRPPNQQSLPVSQDDPETLPPPWAAEEPQLPAADPATSEESEDDLIEPAAYTDRELLENTLKLQIATLQRIDELEQRVGTMESSTQALLPPLERLIKEFLQ